MIGKTIMGRSFKGVIAYCLDESKNAEILHRNGLSNSSVKGLTYELMLIASENKNISKPVWHSILSFANDDKISNEQMSEIACRLMEKAGFSQENHQYVIIKHNDTDHQHCHIVANRIGFDGKAVSDSYSKSRTVQCAKELEQEFDLTRTQEIANNRRVKHQFGRATDSIKEQLKSILNKWLGHNSISTFENFISAIKQDDVESILARHRTSGKAYGVSFVYKGKTYKGSQLGKQFAIKGLSNKLGEPKIIDPKVMLSLEKDTKAEANKTTQKSNHYKI
jgi:hypothetical protein